MLRNLSKKEVKSTIDIENYNIAIATGDLKLYIDCVSGLSKKDINNVNAVLFDDASHNKNPKLLNYLLSDNLFDYHKTNKLVVSCVLYGNVRHLEILIEKTDLFNYTVAKEALKELAFNQCSFHKNTVNDSFISESQLDMISFLLSKYDFDKKYLCYLFLNLFISYSKNKNIYAFSKEYLSFIIYVYQLSGETKNNPEYIDFFSSHSPFYDKHIVDIILTSSKVKYF